MKLQNLIICIPGSILSILAKTIRINPTTKVNNLIVENGLYHFTPNEEVANKILTSGKVKSTKGFNAYGTKGAFMFLGIPSIENHIKNIANSKNNILFDPTEITYAIKINPKLNELSNYKSRIMDEVIIHEGDCIIPQEETKIVQIVKDIQRDKDGNPVLDSNGQKIIILRERTDKEIEMYGNNYIPPQDVLDAIKEYKKRNGYIENDFLGIGNSINTAIHVTTLDTEYSIKNTYKYIKENIKKIFNSPRKIDENPNEKVNRIINGIEQGQVQTKKPVLDSKYVNNIIEFNRQGIKQQTISKLLPEFIESKEGNYLKQKLLSLSNDSIMKSKIHGVEHSNRTTLLALIIAYKEGLNLDDRMLDILITAGKYHDIGRITDIGPHTKRSVKLVNKMDLFFLNGEKYSKEDMNILSAIIDSHEGKKEKSFKMIEKYKIESYDVENTLKLISILRDADALDRARLSKKNKMDLKPEFLQNKSSKGLIDFSFQLESLTGNVNNFSSILNYDKSKLQENEKNLNKERQDFLKEQQNGAPTLEEQSKIIENFNNNNKENKLDINSEIDRE